MMTTEYINISDIGVTSVTQDTCPKNIMKAVNIFLSILPLVLLFSITYSEIYRLNGKEYFYNDIHR